MARSIPEWVGKTDDHRAPASVRSRIVIAHPNCHLCGQPVQNTKWDLDHVKALINGGENREANLRPAHRKCHVAKTAADVAEKAKVAAIRQKHNGAVRPAGKLKGQGFPPPTKSARPPKDNLPPLSYRRLYGPAQPEAIDP